MSLGSTPLGSVSLGSVGTSVLATNASISVNSLFGRRTAGTTPFVIQSVFVTPLIGRRSAGDAPRVGRYSPFAASIWSM